MEHRKIRAIISGGGTGGHIFPALSIADKLKELNPDTEILFVGADGRMEMERVPAAGYRIVGLPVAGLMRKLTLSNFALPFKIIKSVRMAKKVIREFKPDPSQDLPRSRTAKPARLSSTPWQKMIPEKVSPGGNGGPRGQK